MHKINRALLPTEIAENSFQRLVNNHIDELRAHKHRLEMIEKTKHLKDGDPNKWTICPPPSAHPDIINSIVEDGDDYNIQYELFDDTPPKTLDDHKNELNHILNIAARTAHEKIYPSRKMMLLEMDVTDINQDVMDAYNKLKKKTPEALQALYDGLPKAKKDKLDQYKTIQSKQQKVMRHLAEQQAEIHDLTDKNVKTWKHAPFPEV
jgi:hypothetical protein